jgi:hypothetical protein
MAFVSKTARARVDLVLQGKMGLEQAQADSEQVFLLFAAFSGDIFKCAHACDIAPEDITRMAERGNWMERIRALIELKKGEKGPDVERGISRAINFVQANRYRLILERVIRGLDHLSDEDLMDQFVSKKVNKDGEVVVTGVSFRLLADLATALEKTHWMSYQALLDAPQDRSGRREKVKDDGPGNEDVHAKIARALAGVTSQDPVQQVQVAQAEQVAGLAEDIQKAKEQ